MDRCPDCDHVLAIEGEGPRSVDGGMMVPERGHDLGGCWQLLSNTGGEHSSQTCPCRTAYIDGKIDRKLAEV